jgi:hypothetical protein
LIYWISSLPRGWIKLQDPEKVSFRLNTAEVMPDPSDKGFQAAITRQWPLFFA